MLSRSGAACDRRVMLRMLRAVTAGRDHPPAKTERTLASTHCFSPSVMMPASRRQLALKDMKEADGASMMGKISSRFTADFMGLTPFFSLDRLGGGRLRCHLRTVRVIYTLA